MSRGPLILNMALPPFSESLVNIEVTVVNSGDLVPLGATMLGQELSKLKNSWRDFSKKMIFWLLERPMVNLNWDNRHFTLIDHHFKEMCSNLKR